MVRTIVALMRERNMPLVAFPVFVIQYACKAWLFLLMSEIMPPGISEWFHRLRGVKVGKDVFIDRHARIDGAYPEKVIIEDQARITAGACVMAHMKAGQYLADNYFPFVVKEVRICKYAFIGLNAVILPGVTVGEGAVVTCNSVVYQNVKPYTVVTGNPAKMVSRLKKREDAKELPDG